MKKYWFLALLTLVTACAQAPGTYIPKPLSFGKQVPIRLDVAEIRVIDNYHPPLQPPNVEHEFPVMPATIVKQWLAQRVQAVGSKGVFEVTIEDASVKATDLPKTTGFEGLFANDQDVRFDGRLNVMLRLYDGVNAISAASGDVIITRSRTSGEDASINDRTRLFEEMGKDMATSFDMEATLRLRQYFMPYMR